MAQIIIAKHRNGAVGDVMLRFKSEMARFMNPEDEQLSAEAIDSAIKESKINAAPADTADDDITNIMLSQNQEPEPY
jgi:replicative DNA helicase